MTPPARDTTSKYDQILAGLDELKKSVSKDEAWKARVEEKVISLEAKVGRVDKALYGNGEPGVNEALRTYGRRLAELEQIEANCPIDTLVAFAEDMKERHIREDESEKDKKKALELRDSEQRKFRYGLYTAIAISLLDMLARALGVI